MALGKILLVDDEKDIVTLISQYLVAKGYQVVTATRAEDAIQAARSARPDVILMDMMMPDMTGGEAVKLLQSDPRTADIPVLFLTAMITKNGEASGQLNFKVDGRVYDVIAKPVEHGELLGKIEEAMKRKGEG